MSEDQFPRVVSTTDEPVPDHFHTEYLSGAQEAQGRHLAAFYEALGIDANTVSAGDFSITAYTPDIVMVRYPAVKKATNEELRAAFEAMGNARKVQS